MLWLSVPAVLVILFGSSIVLGALTGGPLVGVVSGGIVVLAGIGLLALSDIKKRPTR